MPPPRAWAWPAWALMCAKRTRTRSAPCTLTSARRAGCVQQQQHGHRVVAAGQGMSLPRSWLRCLHIAPLASTSNACCVTAQPPTVTVCSAGMGPRGCVLRGRAASCAAPLPASLCFFPACSSVHRTCAPACILPRCVCHPSPSPCCAPADRHCQAPAVQAVCLRLPAGAAAGAEPPAAARCGLPNVHN